MKRVPAIVNAPTLERFAKAWGLLAAGTSELVYRELTALYSQPHRHYHNLQHIAECLAEFEAACHLTREPLAVELALERFLARERIYATDRFVAKYELQARRNLRDSLRKLKSGLLSGTVPP